ncbi:carbamoyl-phosphate synthase large subunit [Streptococcus pneumoniae]|nr:carbamoyl-phosphate synthase large subunit [Streptococcus pneumoniae]
MEIVENEEDLRSYMRTAVKASPDHPVLGSGDHRRLHQTLSNRSSLPWNDEHPVCYQG